VALTYISDIAEQIRREVPQEVLPDGNTDLLFLIYAVLALTVGEDVQAEDVHDAWSAWMTYSDPSHESIKPFSQLDPETKKTDQPYVDAIRTVATQLF
jgi:hypothetical protein